MLYSVVNPVTITCVSVYLTCWLMEKQGVANALAVTKFVGMAKQVMVMWYSGHGIALDRVLVT